MIVMGISIYLQLTGDPFVSTYGAVFIASLHSVNPFMMKCITSGTQIFAVLLAMYLTDVTGRK